MNKEIESILLELAEIFIHGEATGKYKKEKIPKLDPKIKDTKAIFEKFKLIEKRNSWKMSREEIFYRQAKLMEDYSLEEEIKVKEKFEDLIFQNCTYAGFTFDDFKKYFSWRTKIRKNIYEEINWKYDEIYINELLNLIGVKDEEEAIKKLIEFWSGCRIYQKNLDEKMPDIIKEFYVASNISKNYDEIKKLYPIKVKSKSKDIKDIQNGIFSDKIEFFSQISSYQIAKSKLLETQYGYLLNECTKKVFEKINKEFKENGISLEEMLIDKNKTNYYWAPLMSYAIYDMKSKDKKIVIDGFEVYECKRGAWKRSYCEAKNRYKNIIGYILKLMEYYIREYLGYRKLKMPERSEILKDISEYYCPINERNLIKKIHKMNLQKLIEEEVLICLEDEKIPKMAFKKKKDKKEQEDEIVEKVEIKFNKEQFEKIREKSEEIQKRLIIEEELEENNLEEKKEEIQKTEVVSCDNVYKAFIDSLTETEKQIVRILIEKQNVENKIIEVAKNQNEMLEVIISNINGKALETIGDTVIEENNSSIYEDYENEIKEELLC